ncbi:heme peroxidase [Boothiomyces sp. JEL0838]|nr:heme peroxidase [Boothiomyces sp. JEL0838]KAJ3309193.1 heme peroxidase [Boothiomyces sp. JEL0838]
MKLALLLSAVLAACPYGHSSKREVTALPLTYKNDLTPQEWSDIRIQLGNVFKHFTTPIDVLTPPGQPGYDSFPVGPTCVRLSWHQAGTFDKKAGTGGPHGDVDVSATENNGLKRAIDALAPIGEKYGNRLSKADLWSFAAAVFITNNNNHGLEIKWRPGRADHPVLSGNQTLAVNLPGAEMTADQIRGVFYRMGFNDQEIVTLLGAHSIGFASAINSGYNGAWDLSGEIFTNDFYKRLVSIKGTNPANYTLQPPSVDPFNIPVKVQWQASDLSMMLPSDVLLINDPKWKPITELYAQDEQLFFYEFSKTFQKLNELGVENGLGGYVSTVIPKGNTPQYKVGSPVITNEVNLYYIFYGNWTQPDMDKLKTVGNSISSTKWFQKIKEYYYQAKQFSPRKYINGKVSVKSTTVDHYSLGPILQPGNVTTIISSLVGEGKPLGPADPNGIYLFLFGQDVYEISQFGPYCFSWCQYHSSLSIEGTNIAYGSIGNPNPAGGLPPVLSGNFKSFGCPVCSQTLIPSANGPAEYGTDQVATYIADSVFRMVLNPAGPSSSWADQFGREGSDICGNNGAFGTLPEMTFVPGMSNLNAGGIRMQVGELPSVNGKCSL